MGRILDYPEKPSPGLNDYLLVDSSSEGTKKISASNIVTVDSSLTQPGQPADAKKTGDEITSLKNQIPTVDSTLTQPGQAADAKETGDKITSLKEDLNVVYDVALGENGIGATLKYAVFTSQKITYFETGAYTIAYIPCEPGKAYHITKDVDTTKFDIAYATETLALNTPVYGFVSLQGTAREAVYIPGAGATFLLVQTQGNASHVVFSEYVGKYDNDIVSINETLNDITNSITRTEYTGETDVLSDGVMTADYYFGISGNQAGPFVGVWEYITFDVSKGDTYSVTATAGQLARLWLLLDTSNHVVSYSQDSSASSIKEETIVIPDGVAKMVVNAKIQTVKDRNSLAVVKLSTGVKIAPDAITSNILAGKILCCAGDSITYGTDMDAEGITNISNIDVYQSNSSGEFTKKTNQFLKSWGFQIAERNGMTFYNAGVSGSTMQGISEKNGFSLANGRYTKLPDNIDYLLIWFGWNDTAYGSLGAITDTTNESYYGGYNVVMPYLIDKYPYTKIALIVPFGTDANHRNAIRQLGNKWGVAVWDNYQGGTPLYYGKEPSVGVEQSIVTDNQAKFQANGAHPNYKGHTQLADMIEQFLRGI